MAWAFMRYSSDYIGQERREVADLLRSVRELPNEDM